MAKSKVEDTNMLAIDQNDGELSAKDSKRLRSRIRKICFKYKQVRMAIPLKQVLCILVEQSKTVLFALKNGKIEKYEDIERTLNSFRSLYKEGFVRIHLARVINMLHFESMDTDFNVKLTHDIGQQLAVSQRRQSQLCRYLEQHYH